MILQKKTMQILRISKIMSIKISHKLHLMNFINKFWENITSKFMKRLPFLKLPIKKRLSNIIGFAMKYWIVFWCLRIIHLNVRMKKEILLFLIFISTIVKRLCLILNHWSNKLKLSSRKVFNDNFKNTIK